MNLREIINGQPAGIFPFLEYFKGTDGIQNLIKLRLLPGDTCPKCDDDTNVKTIVDTESIDGLSFKCYTCRKRFSVRRNSFFYKSKLACHEILGIILFFLTEIPVHTCSDFLNISQRTVVDWYQFCREVCVFNLDLVNIKIGGPNCVVQIDESLLFKRKYNRGRTVVQQWFFGGYCVSQKKGFLFPVAARDRATLIPLIEKHVEVGSEIHSDEWAAYSVLGNMGWRHLTVNHSEHFVDPDSGAHTQGVESFWNQIKRKLKFIYGSQGDLKEDRINEYVYRHNFGFNSTTGFFLRFEIFLEHLKIVYPGVKPN